MFLRGWHLTPSVTYLCVCSLVSHLWLCSCHWLCSILPGLACDVAWPFVLIVLLFSLMNKASKTVKILKWISGRLVISFVWTNCKCLIKKKKCEKTNENNEKKKTNRMFFWTTPTARCVTTLLFIVSLQEITSRIFLTFEPQQKKSQTQTNWDARNEMLRFKEMNLNNFCTEQETVNAAFFPLVSRLYDQYKGMFPKKMQKRAKFCGNCPIKYHKKLLTLSTTAINNLLYHKQLI